MDNALRLVGRRSWTKPGLMMALGLGLVLMMLMAACGERPEAEGFMAPELGECVVKVDGYTATVSCSISGRGGIRQSGFIFGKEGDAGQEFPVSPALGLLSMEVKGLEPGTGYAVSAFISSGQSEVRTDPVRFSIKETSPLVHIPDEVFREYCLTHFDRNGDGQLSETEALLIDEIDLVTENISSLEGIESFLHLTRVHVSGSGTDDGQRTGRLTELDLRQNGYLQYVKVYGNNLKELLLPANSNIETIQCSLNMLESIDVSGCPNLKTLYCNDNFLRELDVSENTQLTEFQCMQNALKSLDVSHNTNLTRLYCDFNMLTSIDVSMLSKLDHLSIGDNNISEPVDLSELHELTMYGGNNLPLKVVPDFSHNPKLNSIHICTTGGAYYIDKDYFRDWPEIQDFQIGGYPGETIDLSLNTRMRSLWLGGLKNMREIDLSASPYLKFIHIRGDEKLETIYVHKDVDISKLTVEKDSRVPANLTIIHKSN